MTPLYSYCKVRIQIFKIYFQNSYTTPFKQKHPMWLHKADRTQSRVLYIGCEYSRMSKIIFTQLIEAETNCPPLFQTTISKTFSWMKMYEFRWRFHWICLRGSNNNNIPALAWIIAWCQPGDRPLSEPMMVNLLTHVCATQPQDWIWKRVCVCACSYLLARSGICVHPTSKWTHMWVTCEIFAGIFYRPFKPVL